MCLFRDSSCNDFVTRLPPSRHVHTPVASHFSLHRANTSACLSSWSIMGSGYVTTGYSGTSASSRIFLDSSSSGKTTFPGGIATPSDNAFTVADVKAASKYYQRGYARYPIRRIELKTHLELPRNKRNGRPQALHLERARAVQKIDFPNGEWRNKDGRPIKQQQVQAWRAAHPAGRKIDCERDTGLSRHTVLKWWDTATPTDCQ